MYKTKSQKAITLVALIITIVVLLILAVVAINAITQYNIVDNANLAAQKYVEQAWKENETLGNYDSIINQYLGAVSGENGSGSGDNTGNVSGDVISTRETFVGYYADVDGDGDIDGIIYADLACSKSGQWGSSSGVYSYSSKSNLNKYTVRDATEEEQGLFKDATPKVISPIDKVEENDRFYVMALADVNPGNGYYWYYNAFGNMTDSETATSRDFGTGKENTATMIEKWKSKAYGNQNSKDMWGVIQEEVANGWYVLSRTEWSVFADAFGIDDGNYSEYGLFGAYWSSSQYGAGNASVASLDNGYMSLNYVGGVFYVRLGTTF